MNTRLRLWLLAALLALSASGSLAQVAPPPTSVYGYDGAGNMTRSTSTAVDPQNCGAVGATCGFGKTCCSGACVDTGYDPKNCGTCGRVCTVKTGGAICAGSYCVTSCPADTCLVNGICTSCTPPPPDR